MFLFAIFRGVCSLSSFLYPGYASYKTLSQRPASEEDLERWLMYWSVMGCIVGVEYMAEWVIAWIPAYYLIKTFFLLYLALPQTQGSSYLYVYHLQPFFRKHEIEIDRTLASLKSRALLYMQEYSRKAWSWGLSSVSQPRPSDFAAGHHSELSESGAPPSLHDPASGPAQLIGNLWQSYGPGLVAGGALLLQQSAAAGSAIAMNVSAQRPATKKSASSRSKSSMSNEERRRRLEAELAALEDSDLASPTSPSSASYDIIAPPMGDRDLSVPMSRMSSNSSDIRPPSGRGNSGGFEELEIPSDMEHDRGFIPTEGKNGPTLRPVGNVGA